MAVDPKIFKAYDVRGLYPEEINAEISERRHENPVNILTVDRDTLD
mgnify:CR=1